MEEHLIITMFQIFLILIAVVLAMAGMVALRALWRYCVQWASSAGTRRAAGKKLCVQSQQRPGGT